MKLVLSTLTALITAWGASSAHGQQLPTGTWTGSMTPPGGNPVEVSFEVGEVGGALAMVMRREPEGDIPFRDIRLDGEELTFWWFPGVRVDCTLRRAEDGSFEGPCSDGTTARGDGAMRMVPPAAPR